MAYKLGVRSRLRLNGVHKDLIKVVELALTYSPHDFTITEGLRTMRPRGARQTPRQPRQIS